MPRTKLMDDSPTNRPPSAPDPAEDPTGHARWEMVERQLRARGLKDPRVLEAMRRVPREAFVPLAERTHAYEDEALPIGSGQTISQPFMVAAMAEALELDPGDRVLEIGTGSGYQAAVLAELADQVFSVERVSELADRARRILRDLGISNVHVREGDGTQGWPEEAPFDAILVTAAAPAVPPLLKEQLSPEGGRLVIPVGTRFEQTLERIVRRGDQEDVEHLVPCRFVPLRGAEGWR